MNFPTLFHCGVRRTFLSLSALTSLMLVGACNKNFVEGPSVGAATDEVVFLTKGSGPSYNVTTKATVVDETSLNASGFNVSATTGAAGAETAVWTSQPFTLGEGVFSGNKWWPSTDPGYHFFASNASLTHTADGNTVVASNDVDVVAAYLPSPTYKAVNTLQFEHVFARLGSVTITAESGYTISNVSVRITPKVSGTYNLKTGFGVTDGSAGWSAVTEAASPSVIASQVGANANDIYLVPGTYELKVTWTATVGDYSQIFTDMPAEVSLTAGKVSSFTAELGGLAKEVQFRISVTPWDDDDPTVVLRVPVSTELGIFDSTTGNEISGPVMLADGTSPQTLGTLKSTAKYSDGSVEEVDYSISYSTDGGSSWSGEKPEMISSISVGGVTKAGDDNEVVVTLSERSLVNVVVSTFEPSVGSSSSPVDLSLVEPITGNSMARETANCYIVKGPGYYRIPLIYGAAVVGGVDNLSSAAPIRSSSDDLTYESFKNAFGGVISNSNIVTDVGAGNVGTAKLEWQTVSGMVTVDSALMTEGGVSYLTFQISESNIAEGCALVGVLKNGSSDEYVWSWLIWVVSEEMDLKLMPFYGGDRFGDPIPLSSLNYPLGSSSAPQMCKPARSCMVKFSNAYEESVFMFNQEEVVSSIGSSSSTYYQWGMPCALPPAGSLYSESGSYTFNYDSGNTVLDVAGIISKPYLPRWSLSHMYGKINLWDADCPNSNSPNDPVVKTVYDPCPAGLSVPRRGFFTFLVMSNVVGSFNSGYYFNTSFPDAEPIFLSACGRRSSSNVVDRLGTFGAYWTSSPKNVYYGRYIYFQASSIVSNYDGNRYEACSILPIRWPE